MVNAPSTPGAWEYHKSTGTFTALTPYEVVQGSLGGVLTIDLGQSGTSMTAPFALGVVSKTDTVINVAWQEDADSTTAGHRVYVNGVQWGADLSAAAVAASITGRSPSTTYTITVTRFNGLGQESPTSNALTVTTKAATAGVPTAPSTLTRTAVSDTTVSYSFTETADSSVLRHWRYLDGVRYGAALAATATTFQITGLQAGTHHSAYVTRENATGESAPSPVDSFTTTGGTAVTHDVVMGVPNNDEVSGLRLSSWPAARVYDLTQVQSTVTMWGCRVIGLTDKTNGSNTGLQATADRLKNFLEGFYYTSGGAPKNTGVEIHWAVGNEIDKDSGFTSGSLPPNYIETVRLCFNVVHTLNGDGTRRYPMASCWVDMTQHQIDPKVGNSGPRFKAIAQYLDGMACSMYPPGRDLSKKRPDRPDFTPYAEYVDDVMNVMADWHSTYPNCRQFATWETGIPVDHAFWQAGGTINSNGAPTASTNITIRPRYFTGGIDSAGTDWKGLLQYMYDKLDAMGVSMREQIYWNQCSNPDIPNQLKWDKGKTSPDTETAWHNWQPGVRLAHG